MDQGGRRDERIRSTHLDFSSAQPNRPADFLAHGGCRKAGLKTFAGLVRTPTESEPPTWASRAWSTAVWWGVVSVRVLFFFVGGGVGGGGWGGAPSPRLSLTCRVFSAPGGPLGPTAISVSATFPILCVDASERDCPSSSEGLCFMVKWDGHSDDWGEGYGVCRGT